TAPGRRLPSARTQPGLHALDLAGAVAQRTGVLAGEAPLLNDRLAAEQMRDPEGARERARNDLVGGGHDAAQVASLLMARHQGAAGSREFAADGRLEAGLQRRNVRGCDREQMLCGE